MKTILRLIMACFILLLAGDDMHAQNPVKVKGQVTGDQGQLLPGVTVQAVEIKTRKTSSAITDENGVFTFTSLQSGSSYDFTFSMTGTAGETVKAYTVTADGNDINVNLKQKINTLGEVVVIGYGTQSSRKLTGAVAKIKSDNFKDFPVTNFQQAIAGQVPGVQAVSATGAPGGGMLLRIRGLGTITAGAQPLIVLDGLPLAGANLSSLNVGDIESIEVLKDASAAAIYGSRGANGVVMITTKKGTGKPQYNFSSYYGVQSVTKKIDLMDAYERAALVAEARNNFWVDLNPAVNKPTDPNSVRPNNAKIPDYLLPYLQGTPGLPSTDWQDAIFRNAPIQNYDLSVAGAKDGIRYFISGNYFDQQGIVINSGYKRYSLRSNFEVKLDKRITFTVNFNPSYGKYNIISEGNHKVNGIVLNAMIADPALPLYDDKGNYLLGRQIKEGATYSIGQPENPAALASMTKDVQEDFRILGGASIGVKLAEGLSFKSYLGGSTLSSRENFFKPGALGDWAVAAPTQARAFSKSFRNWNWIFENTINYSRTFNQQHTVSLLAGYTAQKDNTDQNLLNATNFPNDVVQTLNAGQVTSGSSDISEWALLSWLGRATYDFKNKYLFSASLRRDGSSRFGKNTRWGWFPSVSAGWRISEEKFFPKNNFISELKLRGSYGETGNFQIPDYGAVGLLNTTNYVFGGTLVNGQSPSTLPNPDLSWEKTSQFNTGIEIGLMQNKISLIADYYTSTTKGLLLNVPVPASAGVSSSLQNYGKVRNSGFEFAITSKQQFHEWQWDASFNISANKNKVLALGPGQTQIISGTHVTTVGESVGEYFGYKVTGVFKTQEELNAIPHLSTSKIGSYIYADLNTDGKINDQDRTSLGSYFPDFTYGFSNTIRYKGFDLGFLLQGTQGFKLYNQAKVFFYSTEGWSNTSRDMIGTYFKSAGEPGSLFSRPNVRPTDKLFETSDLIVEDGSYLRFRNITLGYSFKPKLLEKMKMKQLRIYASALNPFTFTNYSGYNPEVSTFGSALTPGVDYGAYPLAKSYTFGVNLSF